MKTIGFLLLASLLAAHSTTAATSPALSLAVFDFESKEEAVRDLGPKAASMINATLSMEPNLVLVERTELEKVLGEQELGLSGTVSPETAAKIGQITGAKVLVTGRVFQAGGETVLIAKVIGTETSRVYGEIVKGASSQPITDLSAQLARKIAAIVSEKGETLIAKTKTREERVSALKSSLKAGKLPSVLIKVPEQHFGQPVNDPAVETELGLIFKECGFTILDQKSSQKPDVEISGEAFSAFGARKGNLVTCKARVELKVHNAKGVILAVDRQTSVAIDIAEQTAAKTALQNAAVDLAERIVPQLAKKM